jgi:hypothetical protein
MSYALFVSHPESKTREAEDFVAWQFWAKKNAPFGGIDVAEQAAILDAVCPEDVTGDICEVLDAGGELTAVQARLVAKQADAVMSRPIKRLYAAAVDGGYGVRVEFKRGAFGAPSASEYLAKSASD